jgi:CRP-like cAMP-binding protein
MDARQLQYVLEELNFSAALPPPVLEQLAAAATVRRVPAGTVVFREGSENHDLYLVRSGRVGLEMRVPGRGSVCILTLGPGEMVGWSALLDRHSRMTAGAVALEETELVVAEAGKLRELCEASHDFGYHLMRQMAGALSARLVATRLQLLDLFADVPPVIPAARSEREG